MKTTQKILTLLSAIGILCWGVAVFVGVHFASAGSWPASVAVGLASILLMGFFFFLSSHFAQPRSASEYGRSVEVKKWVFIAIYWALSLGSLPYVLHAVGCTTSLKEDIRSKAGEEFEALQIMVSKDGSQQGSYKEYVDGILANYRNSNPNHLTDADKLDMELTDLSDQFLVSSGYPALRAAIVAYWEPASYAVDHWDIFTVSDCLHELDSRKTEWDAKIAECSKYPTGSKYDLTDIWREYKAPELTYTDLSEPLRHPSLGQAPALGWLLVVVLQALIMLSWITVCRSRFKNPLGDKKVNTW